MAPDVLEPSLDLLRQEYVLIQAWKKTASYIRYHNWYADTLELDWTTVNLPAFIGETMECLKHPKRWQNQPLRLVPAPKSQPWSVSPKTGRWAPRRGLERNRLRPLAHAGLRDQVVATGLMLCLANRVETKQGDPQGSIDNAQGRRRVGSYGNRLFCDRVGENLYHRWGSAKLYRSYFEDYRTFVYRPVVVAESVERTPGRRVFMVESDLEQFYDRVHPDRLAASLHPFQRDASESAFFDFAKRLLDWRWHTSDLSEVSSYFQRSGLSDFSRVALPQGLVAAGFFANVVLVELDGRLRSKVGTEIAPGIHLEDGCRYVDDLRLVVTAEPKYDVGTIAGRVYDWLEELLSDTDGALVLSRKKSRIAEFGGSERPLVRQSTRMNRIQSAVSGGFDVVGGIEILDSVQGLMRAQEELNRATSESGWRLSPQPDVGEETVARFLAVRFRTTYRSIRPLLEHRASSASVRGRVSGSATDIGSRLPYRSTEELDEDARAFALALVGRWVEDPSNVRLLRIGLDIWPDASVLKEVIGLLRPFTEKGALRGAPRRVAWYCFAELLRAGATETGVVDDDEKLPEGVDFAQFRRLLVAEALRLVGLPPRSIPWYLRQQALLFLAVVSPIHAPVTRSTKDSETGDYRRLILFLRGDTSGVSDGDFATMAILLRRAFGGAGVADLLRWGLSPDRRREIALRDPVFARELGEIVEDYFDGLPARIREDLYADDTERDDVLQGLVDIVMADPLRNPLRNELSLLRFAAAFLDRLQELDDGPFRVFTPGQIQISMSVDGNIADIQSVHVTPSSTPPSGSLYEPPVWCESDFRWRFHLGFLLRFILSGQPDFTVNAASSSSAKHSGTYKPVKSHWYQRIYGLFNAQEAFGHDWLPVSDWMEHFLMMLLRWPGCRSIGSFNWIEDGINRTKKEVTARIKILAGKRGRASGVLLLPMNIATADDDGPRSLLRACIVQTVIPAIDDVSALDLSFSSRRVRREHRVHLSAALAAVARMLDLRATHYQGDRNLDWLILPELSVHPDDVQTHLVPFARKFKTLILTGLTYEELFIGEPLINSALWIIPEWSRAGGLQVRQRRQGKCHLAPDERQYFLQGFRPCQWLVQYPWAAGREPVTLTAAVCYDATDLALAADLRVESDVFAVPALNKDVNTFDQMAQALHYHMYQLVVVVNNGKYGGSNAYWPIADNHRRALFHLHGQPQASIGFFEIDNIPDYLDRRRNSRRSVQRSRPTGWKYPPAGLEPIR